MKSKQARGSERRYGGAPLQLPRDTHLEPYCSAARARDLRGNSISELRAFASKLFSHLLSNAHESTETLAALPRAALREARARSISGWMSAAHTRRSDPWARAHSAASKLTDPSQRDIASRADGGSSHHTRDRDTIFFYKYQQNKNKKHFTERFLLKSCR